MGFRKAMENNSFLLYYPLKEGYIHKPKAGEFNPNRKIEAKRLYSTILHAHFEYTSLDK